MKLTKKIYYTRHRYEEEYVLGYIDTETVMYQDLRYKIMFLGLRIWSKTYHSERVPAYAWIQNNILGYTDWISPYKDIINEHNKKTKQIEK